MMQDEKMMTKADRSTLEHERERQEQMPEEELFKLRKESSLFVTCKPWLHRLSQIHGLPYMINLTSLTLHMNELNELDVDVLSHLRQLEELDLSGNEISSISSQTFTAQRKLKRLNLSSNQLCSVAPMSFKYLYSLEWLCLAFNELDDITSLSHIPPTAPLLHVDVCGNNIDKLENVQEALSTHGKQLQSLRLRIPRTSQITALVQTSTTTENYGVESKRQNSDKVIDRKSWDVELTRQKTHQRESSPKQKVDNYETWLNTEENTSIPFVHENPFLQPFNLTTNVNESSYVQEILHFCPNLHTLDGNVCGMNALELISHTEEEKKEHQEEQPVVLVQQEEEVDSTNPSTIPCTSRSHSSHVKNDNNNIKNKNLETKSRRLHSRPLLTSPHAINTDKNKSAIELSFTSSSSSSSPESTLSSRTREGSKVANSNTNTSTSTNSAARSLDYSVTNCNKMKKWLPSEELSYDVSLIEAELNDVLYKKQKNDDNYVKQELHSLFNNNSYHNNTNYDALYNSSGRDNKTTAQRDLLSNFVLEKMPEIDKPADGEMELSELRSGRPVHSLRWRPHRRTVGLNTMISMTSKETLDNTVNLYFISNSTEISNTDVSTSRNNDNDIDKATNVNNSDSSNKHQVAGGSISTQKMQSVLDAFGLHSELIDALQHEKKDMCKRLGKAMQQMALQRATEVELHQEIVFTRNALTQYRVKSTHTINKQQSQISSLKDELLRRASEIQIMHKRSNADLTSLQQHLTRSYHSNVISWTSLLTSQFIVKLHLLWQEWSAEREWFAKEIYQSYKSISLMEARELQNKSEQTRQLTEWESAQNATRRELTHLQEEISSQKAQFTLQTLEITFRQRVIDEEQKLREDLLTRPFWQKSTELITHKSALKTFNEELICKEAEWTREYENMKSSYEEALAHAKDELCKLQRELTKYKKEEEQQQEEQERQQQQEEVKATNSVSNANTEANANAKKLLDEQQNVTPPTTTKKLEEDSQSNQAGVHVTHPIDTVSELVEYWKVMCATREHEIEQLRVACSVSESTQQALSNENTRLLHKNDEEAKEYEAKQSQFARERENLLRALHNVEDSLKKKDKELDLLEEEAKTKIDEKRTRIAELEQINDELVEEHKNIAEQNVKLRSSLETVENELHKTQCTVQDAEHTNQVQSQRIQELENQVHELQATQVESNTIQEELIKTKSTLVAALRSARDQLMTLHQSHLTLSQQQQLWESMYASKDEEVRRLQRQVAELQSSSRERQRATLAALSQVILNEHSVEPISNNAVTNQIE